jgi:hypothetical protein
MEEIFKFSLSAKRENNKLTQREASFVRVQIKGPSYVIFYTLSAKYTGSPCVGVGNQEFSWLDVYKVDSYSVRDVEQYHNFWKQPKSRHPQAEEIVKLLQVVVKFVAHYPNERPNTKEGVKRIA